MNDDDLVLVDRWLDGELPLAERQALHRRLQLDAAFAAEFAQEVRLQGLLSSLLDGGDGVLARVEALIDNGSHSGAQRMVEAVDDRLRQNRSTQLPVIAPGRQRVARPSRRLRARRRSRILPMVLVLASVAALLVVGILVWERTPTSAPETAPALVVATLAHLVDGSRGTFLVHQGREGVRRPAPPGTALEDGDGIIVDDGGSAVVLFDDGTRLIADPGTTLSFTQAGDAKRIHEASGTFAAHVAPQRPGQALVVTTPQARAEIVGTVFTLAVTADLSRLTVSEGRIAFAALAAPTQPLLVSAGGSAEVRDGVVRPGFGASPLWADADALKQVIPMTAEEAAWQQVPWMTSIAAARASARSLRRPLLVWVGWGHPLGMASPDTLTARSGCMEDPGLIALIAGRCVPLAIDFWSLRQQTDADSRWLVQTVMKTTLSRRTHQGLVLMDAEGALLGDISGDRQGAEVCAKLGPLLAQVAAGPPCAPNPAPAPRPPGMLIATIASRRLVHDAGQWTAYHGTTPPVPVPGLDSVWLSRGEWQGLLPQVPTPGLVFAVPRPLALKFARFVLLDGTLGEGTSWEEAAVARAELRVRVRSVDPEAWELELEGHTTCGRDGFGYDAEVIGWLRYRPATRTMERFDLLAVGDRWGNDPFSEPAPAGRQPLGVLIHLDPREQAGDLLPHAAQRESGYFTVP